MDYTTCNGNCNVDLDYKDRYDIALREFIDECINRNVERFEIVKAMAQDSKYPVVVMDSKILLEVLDSLFEDAITGEILLDCDEEGIFILRTE